MTILSAQTIRERVRRTQAEGIPKIGGPGIYDLTDALRFNIEPFEEAGKHTGMSYGLSGCGYDIRIGKINQGAWRRGPNERAGDKNWDPHGAQEVVIKPGAFLLLSSLERLEIPHDLAGFVCDKSTLARKGLALQNTVLEPGWKGYITLELSNHGRETLCIRVGQPIAQVVFHQLDKPTELPYVGKYQNQAAEPTEAKFVPDDLP
ncbi:dCTP deaminase [Brevundimonas phage vB_BpoS-MaInes]|nr:dCTP deaminase [Brevundimonas phage vB_BpoS-MaInes]